MTNPAGRRECFLLPLGEGSKNLFSLNPRRLRMTLKTLLALSVAAAFAAPLAVYGAGDKAKSEAGATPSASQGASGASGATGSAASGGSKSGAQAMFEKMDKDKDGSVSKEEAA